MKQRTMFVLGGVTIRSRCLVSAALCLASIFGPTTFAQVRPIPLAPSVAEEPSTTTPPSEREPLAVSPTPPASSTSAPSTSASSSSTPRADNGTRETDPSEAWLQQVAQRQQALLTDTERTPEVKEQLTKIYEQLRLDWEATLKAQSRIKEYSEAAAAAPGLLETAKARKAELETNKAYSAAVQDPSWLSYEELEQKRLALEAELATHSSERTTLTEAMAKRDKRRKELPQLISDAKSKLDQMGKEPPTAGASDDPLLREANAWSFDVSRKLLSAQQQSNEAEQRLYEAEASLLPLQLELVQATEKRKQEHLRLINEQLDKIRTNRILNTSREARSLIEAAPEEFKPVGEQLLIQIEAWKKLAAEQASVKTELEEAQRQFERWSERRTKMETRVEPKAGSEGVSNVITGFNSWVGLMLRKQRSELPDPQQLEAKLREYQEEMQLTESLLFGIEDARQDIEQKQEQLEARESQLDSASHGAGPELTGPELTGPVREGPAIAIADEFRAASELLKFSVSTLNTMKLDVNAYQDDLYTLADVRERTIRSTSEYRDFIDKHVLWIRSTDRLSSADWKAGTEAFAWLVDYQNWLTVGVLFGRDVVDQPVWTILLLLLLLVLIWNQSRLRHRLAGLSAKAEKKNCTNYHFTVRSLILTLLISMPLPLLMYFFQLRLGSAAAGVGAQLTGADFSVSLAAGLRLAAIVFFPLEFVRQLCRADGLGIKHFEWNEKVVLRLRANLRWLINFCVPLAGIIGMFHNHVAQRWESSLGRVAFIVLMPLLSLFLARVLAPRSGIVSGFLSSHRGGWLDRLSWLWYPVLCILPLGLAAVSYVGYHYTSQRLAAHVVSTQWMIVLVAISYFMLLRWLVLNRRRLMLAQARQRLEDAAKRDPSGEVPAPSEVPRIDLVAINEQTKRLVTSFMVTFGLVTLFVIWSDVFPAVTMLEEIRLWPLQGEVTKEDFSITLASVLVVIPIGVLFVISGRNVPGLLEIAFLQHLPLTNAARYAITTLSRYAIFSLGIIVVASIIGLKWQSIQWLVAALGVGLGFGLQEIFANFVSGIILLFEQPIRVGDIISIDGTTGSVSKIRMRATTIINWDRQELIVPNKDLITGKLLNWTLTDSTNRIYINVGVAYGSDTRKACSLMMQICQEFPNVLQDPAPSVTFEGFGDNTLNLVLRAFLQSLDNRLATIHELHQQIYQAFNAAGIEIAFPQRDLHLRSLPETLNRWLDKRTTSERS
ncbi:MAG: mechanosensitive ion channel [Pirellulaceae bacterium]|nr:mechanosensitive ion channel [Pirellulaceae bacterium]